jgi:hypothetical protein
MPGVQWAVRDRRDRPAPLHGDPLEGDPVGPIQAQPGGSTASGESGPAAATPRVNPPQPQPGGSTASGEGGQTLEQRLTRIIADPHTIRDRTDGSLAALVILHHNEEARNIVQRSDVPSDWNLSAFMSWCSHVDAIRAAVYISHCPVINHRLPDTGIPVMEPHARLVDGRFLPLFSLNCAGNDCERCATLRGGYRFWYVGPWTCTNAFGDNLTDRTPLGARTAWMNCRSCRACRARGSAVQP